MIVSFTDFLEKHHITDKKIAVGVSGGSDSLALVIAAHEALFPLGYQLIALTVDHRLRPSSAQEAAFVSQTMQDLGIEHHTLIWEHGATATGIEEAARHARYKLLEQWCLSNNCNILMTAHHLEDQAETFLMRLQRGSGLDGLCGMREVTNLHKIKLIRPILDVSKSTMQNYLLQKNIFWVEDESNQCEDFLRCRIRKFLPEFTKQTGITSVRICETMKRLQSSQNFLAQMTDKSLQRLFKYWPNAGYCCKISDWEKTDSEIQFRLISLITKNLTHSDYTPRAKNIISLIENLKNSGFKSATLGGCLFILSHDILWITREHQDYKNYRIENWNNYLDKNPKLKKHHIPYKMRLALLAAEFIESPQSMPL